MVSIPNALAITQCNQIVDSFDTGGAGTLRIYAGTPPANIDAALSGNTLLAQLTLSNPAFGSAVDVSPGARATANSITADSSADATGTASFARIYDGGGTARAQFTVSASGGSGELQLSTTSIVALGTVSVTSLTITVPE